MAGSDHRWLQTQNRRGFLQRLVGGFEGCAVIVRPLVTSENDVATTTGPTEFVRLLHTATRPRSNHPTQKRVDLEPIDVLSLLAAASWNVSFMLLDRFLRDLGFRRVPEVQRACRYATVVPVVVLVTQYRARASKRAHLLYAECGRFRTSGAFFEDAVAIIRAGQIVAYPVPAIDESVLAASSLFAECFEAQRRDFPRRRTPPAA